MAAWLSRTPPTHPHAAPCRLLDKLLVSYGSMAEKDMMGMAHMYASMVFDHVAPDDPECLTQACLARAVNVSPRELDMLWDIFDQVGSSALLTWVLVGCSAHTRTLVGCSAHTRVLVGCRAHTRTLVGCSAHTLTHVNGAIMQ